jgi:hypothetical protein
MERGTWREPTPRFVMVTRNGPQVWLSEREKGGRVEQNRGHSSMYLSVEKEPPGRSLARDSFVAVEGAIC